MPPLDVKYEKVYPGGPEDRRRSQAVTAGIALTISVLFGLLVSLYITSVVKSQIQHDALHAAQVNCHALKDSRLSGNRFRFGIREELAFIPDLIAASKRNAFHQKLDKKGAKFIADEISRLNRDLARERVRVPGLPAHVASFGDLFLLFADTPTLNCSTATLTG